MQVKTKRIVIVVVSVFLLLGFAAGCRDFFSRFWGEGLNGGDGEKKSLELEDQNVPSIPQKLGVEARQVRLLASLLKNILRE